jgi:hypothetical protein
MLGGRNFEDGPPFCAEIPPGPGQVPKKTRHRKTRFGFFVKNFIFPKRKMGKKCPPCTRDLTL